MGRNCRFLQGKETNRQTVDELKSAIKSSKEITVKLLNYKKSGEPFWNLLSVAPMSEQSGQTKFYIGIQVDITDPEHASEQNARIKGQSNIIKSAVNQM